MGIFSLFNRKTTAEEREERSRKEREMAQRYYDMGYSLGERLGLHRAVERTNAFINRYPVTSFAAFIAAIVVMFIMNTLLVKVDFNKQAEHDMGNAARSTVSLGEDSLQVVMEGLLDEYTALHGELEDIMGRKDLSKEDSLRAIDIYKRILRLEDVLTGGSQAGGTDTEDPDKGGEP